MTIVAPALRGDDPLGFLAAVGVVALSEQGEIPAVSLSWKGVSAPVAAFDGPSSLEDLGDALEASLNRLVERSELIPGLGADFPPSNKGATKDRMRMSREDLAELYRAAGERWLRARDPWLARWLIGLTAQVASKDDGRVELTPFYAPTGRMTLRGSLLEAPRDAVREIGGPKDAFVRWRRVAFDGANFDDRAKRDAAVTTTGDPGNRGAPSPTWLAVMGMRMFPITDDGHSVSAVGWQRVCLYPGFTRRSLVWPVWSMALDAPAVRTILAHPIMRLAGSSDDPRLQGVAPQQFSALGISAVFGASRRTLSQGDGPLGPARRLWPS